MRLELEDLDDEGPVHYDMTDNWMKGAWCTCRAFVIT